MFALLIYRFFLLLLLPIVLLALLLRSKNNKAYRQRITERLGFFPMPAQTGGIIVHAASVGEVIALKPFIEQLLQAYPNLSITVTTFTPTGSAQVKKLFNNSVQHGYLPLDIMPCTQLFLQRLKPKLVILMETELWPNFIAQCANKKIKLLLINARLSKKSMVSYQKLRYLIVPTLNHFDKILTQSQDNLENFLHLGAAPKNCLVSGNLKFDSKINSLIEQKQAELKKLLPSTRKLWLVASTHEGDEQIALEAFKIVENLFPQLLLVIVPRHPERFTQVAQLALHHNFTVAKRSESTKVTKQNIWLLDTLGELMATFSLADIVTMGGSFSHIGGHNPLEPALFKKPIIVGSDMGNFTEILAQLQQKSAIIQLPAVSTQLNSIQKSTRQAQQLAQSVIHLLQQETLQTTLGYNAYQVVLANQGASERTLTQVKALL
ncbi:MAG: lipid IV(A) 3-deoxy-D-manno-octulosonic acid transferase [Colwellia sp.]